MNKPKLTWRVVTSVVVAIALYAANSAYEVFRTSFVASMAVKQVEDSVLTYSLIQQLIVGNKVPSILMVTLLIILAIIWGTYVVALARPSDKQ